MPLAPDEIQSLFEQQAAPTNPLYPPVPSERGFSGYGQRADYIQQLFEGNGGFEAPDSPNAFAEAGRTIYSIPENIRRGALNAAGGVLQGGAELSDKLERNTGLFDYPDKPKVEDRFLYQAGKAIKDFAAEPTIDEKVLGRRNPEVKATAGTLENYATEEVPQAAGSTLTFAAGGAGGAGLLGASAFGALSNMGDAREEAKSLGLSEEQTREYTNVMGSLGTLEGFPLFEQAIRSTPGAKKLLSNLVARSVAFQAGEEAMQEGVSAFGQEITKRAMKEPDKTIRQVAEEAAKDPSVWKQAFTGLLVGGIGGGISGVSQAEAQAPLTQSEAPTDLPAPEPAQEAVAPIETPVAPPIAAELPSPQDFSASNPEKAAEFRLRDSLSRRDFIEAGLPKATSKADRDAFLAGLKAGVSENPEAVAPVEEQPAEEEPVLAESSARTAGDFSFPSSTTDMRTESKRDISPHDVIATIAKDFNIPIRMGRVTGGVAGLHLTKPEVIRLASKFGGDIGVASHELAHQLDKEGSLTSRFGTRATLPPAVMKELKGLDYDPKEGRAFEGWAEFIRHYMTGSENAQTVAPLTSAWFEQYLHKNPELAAKAGKVRGLIRDYSASGALSRGRGQISFDGKAGTPLDETLNQRIRDAMKAARDWYTYEFRDDADPILQYQNDYLRKGGKAPKGERIYEMYSALRGTAANKAERAFEEGVFTISEGAEKKIGPALKDALQMVDPKDYQNWVTWMVAQHALEVHDTQSRQEKENEKAKAEKRKPVQVREIDPGMAKADAQKIYEDGLELHPEWAEAAKIVTDFNSALVRMMQDSGVIDKAEADAITGAYKTYVPLRRAIPETMKKLPPSMRKTVDVASPLKGRKGSSRKVIDPVISTMYYAQTFYNRAIQQELQNTIIDHAEEVDGLGSWVEKVPPKQRRENLTVDDVREQLEKLGVDPAQFENLDPAAALAIWKPDYLARNAGENVFRMDGELYEIDPQLARVLAGTDAAGALALPFRIWNMMNTVTKKGSTSANPSFGATNFPRDMQDFVMQSTNTSPIKGTKDSLKLIGSYMNAGLEHLQGKSPSSPYVKLFKEFGGEMGTSLGLDTARIRTTVDDLMADSVKARALNIVKSPLSTLEKVISATEVGPRLAEFKGVLDKAGYTEERLKAGEMPPRAVLVEAINAAHRVTIDFRRGGRIAKLLNRFIPFFNAGLQGNEKFLSNLKNNRKKATAFAAVFAALGILHYLMHKDEDWYKEAPPWLKYGFWTISWDGKPIIRIPRAHLSGLIFASGPEAILNKLDGEGIDPLSGWLGQFAQKAIPNWKPAVATPLVEAFANKDTFRGTAIVPDSLANLQPRDQYTSYNTELMKAIGDYLNVSPAKLEHVVSGVTGGAYRRVEKLIESPGELVPADIPGISGFVMRGEYNASVNNFYEESDKVSREYYSAKAKGDVPPELEARQRVFQEYRSLMTDIRQASPDPEGRDDKLKYDRYITGLARRALGLPELSRYPDPISNAGQMPAEIKAVRDDFVGKKLFLLTAPKPTDADNVPEWEDSKAKAREVLEGVLASERSSLLRSEAKRRGMKTDSDAFEARRNRL